jgi:hypothetical protein
MRRFAFAASALFVALGAGGPDKEVVTPPARGERQKDKLRVGQPAPDFTLPVAVGEGKVTLSRFRGRKPVVLIFGSYT